MTLAPGGAAAIATRSAILLTDGPVLVLGGLQAATATDVFDPTADLWQPGPILEPAWGDGTAS